MSTDLYGVLGVPRDADTPTIKKAYRKLAAKHHPDRNKDDPAAEARFKEVNHAYEVLSDDGKRAMYDDLGPKAEELGYDPERVAAWRQAQAFQGGFGGGVDLNDVFAEMFGGHRNGANPFAGAGDGPFSFHQGPRRGADRSATVRLSLERAVLGGETRLRLDGQSVTVRIPPGAKDGGTLRLRGKGAPGPAGPGDLLLTIEITPHDRFRPDGDDLRTTVRVTLGEALRGASVDLPLLDGSVRLKIPPGTQPGATLRLRGRGMPRRGREAGDLLVTVEVVLPTLPSSDQEDAPSQALDEAVATLEALYQDPVR